MITAVIFFISGLLIGFILLGSIAFGRHEALWRAVRTAAYLNDTSLCKQVVEDYQR